MPRSTPLYLLALLSITACRRDLPVAVPDGAPLSVEQARVDSVGIRIVPPDQLPYRGYEPADIEYPGDHPVFLADKALVFLDNFRTSGREEYLDAALECARRMLALSGIHDGALFFTYGSDFELHGDSGDVMRAPWYSGMAQGMALSVFARLYTATGDSTWLDQADLVLPSLLRMEGTSDPWTATVDSDGYFWIEEYPTASNAFTLNGFVFAVIGVYDYWLVRPVADAEWLLQASITSLKRYAGRFRNPGGISRYCLRHGTLSKKYHQVHIGQMSFLYTISGDSFFLDLAHELDRDCCTLYPFSRSHVRFPGIPASRP